MAATSPLLPPSLSYSAAAPHHAKAYFSEVAHSIVGCGSNLLLDASAHAFCHADEAMWRLAERWPTASHHLPSLPVAAKAGQWFLRTYLGRSDTAAVVDAAEKTGGATTVEVGEAFADLQTTLCLAPTPTYNALQSRKDPTTTTTPPRSFLSVPASVTSVAAKKASSSLLNLRGPDFAIGCVLRVDEFFWACVAHGWRRYASSSSSSFDLHQCWSELADHLSHDGSETPSDSVHVAATNASQETACTAKLLGGKLAGTTVATLRAAATALPMRVGKEDVLLEFVGMPLAIPSAASFSEFEMWEDIHDALWN